MAEFGPWAHKEKQDRYLHKVDNNFCSFCGSLHPGEFIDLLATGLEIIPTDKAYKAYLEGGAKFYYQHLSDAQIHRFIELYNSKVMNVGYPGYFYVLPFFMGPKNG